MKQNPRILISFSVVLLLGGLVFNSQSRRLQTLQNRSEQVRAAKSSSEDGTPADPAGSMQQKTMPRDAASGPEATLLLDRLKARLLSSVTAEQLAALCDQAGEDQRVAGTAKLTEAERPAFQQALTKFNREKAVIYLNTDLTAAARVDQLAGVKRRREAWLAEQLGEKRNAARLLADEQATRIARQHGADAAVARLSQTVDLTTDQKEKLHAGFVENLTSEAAQTDPALVVKTFGGLDTTPLSPDITEDMEKILTPDQLQSYRQKQQASGELEMNKEELIFTMMQSLLPALFGLAEEER